MDGNIIARLDRTYSMYPTLRASEVPTESELAAAETNLGIAFAEDYREFVLRYGGAMVGAFPVFGLRPVKFMGPECWSVVDNTRRYRQQCQELLNWIIFSEDQAGNPIGFDAAGTVWIFDHDFGGVALHSDNFEAYLQYCLSFVDE